jgi:HupE / UreJ protein
VTLVARIVAVFLFLMFWTEAVEAHSQSYGYLSLNEEGAKLTGRLEVAIRDLDRMLALDANGDGTITWGDVRLNEATIASQALVRITIVRGADQCSLGGGETLIDSHGGENYLVIPFEAACPSTIGPLIITYQLLFDIDAQHRGLVSVTTEGEQQSFVVSPAQAPLTITARKVSIFERTLTFTKHGMHHLWSGYDHMLFLITLLLGTVMLTGARGLGHRLIESVKVVTAFTLSHSITLGFAAAGVVRLPVALTESLIAMTIALAALNNIWPVVKHRIWLVALFFGLIHGLGFANVLTDLGMRRADLVLSLFAFNLGVELAQIAVVIIVLPVLFLIARGSSHRGALIAANAVITAIGVAWFFDRMAGTQMMPF